MEVSKIEIYETEFEYSEWNEANYSPSELLITSSIVQLGGGKVPGDDLKGFKVRVQYGLVDTKENWNFKFSGTKNFLFPLEYSSVHLLSFLTEYTIKAFDTEFSYRKVHSKVSRHKFFSRKIEDLYDDLMDTLSLIRSEEAPK